MNTSGPHAKRLMVIGAHPDDAEFHAGGLMVQWHEAGGEVMIVSLTDGSAGHQSMSRDDLAKRRHAEALAAAALLAAKLEIWDVPDGELQADLALRARLIRQIRRFAPNLIVTHRPADYHPDHRATAQLVQDACYLLQVPAVVADTPALSSIPPVLLCADRFSYPRPFRADWLIDTTAELPRVVDLLNCHESQVYEWLPHTQGIEAPEQNRKTWLAKWYARRPMYVARTHADSQVECAEAFEISEYGGPFDASNFQAITSL